MSRSRPPAARALTVAALVACLPTACSAPTSTEPDRAPTGPTVSTVAYGNDSHQVADLYVPDERSDHPTPVVVLIHGGYWRSGYERSLETALADDLVSDGYVVWNVEYRAADDPGGGWPGTYDDVAAAVDILPSALETAGVDAGPVAVVGHSAGGTLALWLGARGGLADGAVGSDPRLVPDAVVSQAGVNDLERASATGAGGGAIDALLGGRPDEVPERYAVASPVRRVPLGVDTLVLTGALDATVPVEQTTLYGDAAEAAGDTVTTLTVDGEDHFAHLDPTSDSWAAVRTYLESTVGPARADDVSSG
ncbi:alpha/beta hydrolase family protein [Paraoerskovia marina]|uniref:alpha/beta hydrolase family protein n=1 Tax=Paraoerskovia marina TaxID=545619 RepID=UPI0006945BD0|nr:alpha/beta hydrolase [Paraoerskovia marina]